MKIGFVGLGIMGKPMAKNLLKAGLNLIVYDLNPNAVQEVAAAGAAAAKSVAEAAAEADVFFTMLPNSPEVREVLLGGQDVRTSAETTKDEYKKAHYPERAEFTRRFYEYARENPDLKVSYTQWTAEHGYRY